MLRITVVDSSKSVVTLRVEGQLTGRGVAELRQSCELHTLGEANGLILDLTDVSFADAEGVKLLKDLKIRNVVLLNLAWFLDLQLRDPLGGKRSTRNKNDEPEGDQ